MSISANKGMREVACPRPMGAVPKAHRCLCSPMLYRPRTQWRWSLLLLKVGVQLLVTQKPIKKSGGWKQKFGLFWMPASAEVGGLEEHVCPKADSSSMTISKSKSFCRLREGTIRIVILKSVIGGLTSIILIVLSTVNLQFCGLFPFPEAYSWKHGSLCHGQSLVIM